MIIVNFKNYKKGKAVVDLAKKLKKYKVIAAVPATEVKAVAKTGIKTYAQHVDSESGNRATGYVLPSVLKKDGASGSLLNHSEHRVSFKTIKETIKSTKIKLIVCAASLSEAAKIKKLKPWAIKFLNLFKKSVSISSGTIKEPPTAIT